MNLIQYVVDEEKSVYCVYAREVDSLIYYLTKIEKSGLQVWDVLIELPEHSKNKNAIERIEYISMGQVSTQGQLVLSNQYGDLYVFNELGELLDVGSAGWDSESYHGTRCGLVNAGTSGIFTYKIEREEILFQ